MPSLFPHLNKSLSPPPKELDSSRNGLLMIGSEVPSAAQVKELKRRQERAAQERRDEVSCAGAVARALQEPGGKAGGAYCQGAPAGVRGRIEGLRRITCPSLILYGEHDVLFVEASELMAREIPDARRIVMKGRGHMTALEDPEGLAAHLIGFLEGLENGVGPQRILDHERSALRDGF